MNSSTRKSEINFWVFLIIHRIFHSFYNVPWCVYNTYNKKCIQVHFIVIKINFGRHLNVFNRSCTIAHNYPIFNDNTFNTYILIYSIHSTGVVFAFVWASFLPPVKRYRYNDDAIAKLMVQHNNNEQPSLMVRNYSSIIICNWQYCFMQ